MSRPKKYPDAEKTIAAFFASISDAFNHPSAGERSLDGHKPINLLAEEFGISRLKVRKILITSGDVVYPETARIQGMLKNGMKKPQACAETGMAISTLNSFLPYEKGVYNLADVSTYAESSRLYRERKEAVLTLQSAPSSLNLWKTLIVFAGYPFVTSGRGEKGGVKFKYSVSAEVGAGGKHYDGTSVDGFGNELWIVKNGQRAEKSISRYSVDYALKIAIETQEHAGQITGPKQLKIYGASYIFALFRRFGLV